MHCRIVGGLSDDSNTILRSQLAKIPDPSGLLEKIFASAPVGLQIYERDGRCLAVNAAHTELFGGVPPLEFNIFEDTILRDRGMTDLVKRAFDGETISVPAIWYDIRELRNLPPDADVSGGKRIAIATELIPLRDADSTVTHVLFVFRDDTKIMQAHDEARIAAEQAEIRATQALFLAEASRVLESLDFEATLSKVAKLATERLADFCIVDLVDEDGAFRRVAAEHAIPEAQPLLDELKKLFPPFIGSPQPAARVIASGKPELLPIVDDGDLERRTMTDEHEDLMARLDVRSHLAVPLQIGDRTLGAISLGYTGDRRYTLADVPLAEALASRAAVAIEHARLFREAEAARADAEAASRTKDEFLAMLGHELRNPLAPIVTALEMTRGKEGVDISRERAVIERQVDHLRRLVDDLLDVARITRGTLELDRKPIDLAEAITDGVEAARSLVDQRRHRLALELPTGHTAFADRNRIAQLVSNLVTNAARYTDPGGKITVSLVRRGSDLVLRVCDTGAGIPEDLLPRIFEIFTRGGRQEGGLGLGLAIVRSLAELHGGGVTARSAGPGKGSELEVRIPAHEASMPATRARTPVSSTNPPVRGEQGGHILIVDDNADAADLLAEALTEYGFRCVVSHDPFDALALSRARRPRLAVIDIGLPGIDGYELGRRLLAEPGNERMPIVALTGFGQPNDRKRSVLAGFAEHLVKPVQLETLVPLLERLLARQ